MTDDHPSDDMNELPADDPVRMLRDTTPAEHGPTFWTDLEDRLHAEPTSVAATPAAAARNWKPLLVGAAAALLIAVGVGGILASTLDDPKQPITINQPDPGQLESDGSNAGQQQRELEPADPAPTATAAPQPTATAAPRPTATPFAPRPSATPTATAVPVPSPTPHPDRISLGPIPDEVSAQVAELMERHQRAINDQDIAAEMATLSPDYAATRNTDPIEDPQVRLRNWTLLNESWWQGGSQRFVHLNIATDVDLFYSDERIAPSCERWLLSYSLQEVEGADGDWEIYWSDVLDGPNNPQACLE